MYCVLVLVHTLNWWAPLLSSQIEKQRVNHISGATTPTNANQQCSTLHIYADLNCHVVQRLHARFGDIPLESRVFYFAVATKLPTRTYQSVLYHTHYQVPGTVMYRCNFRTIPKSTKRERRRWPRAVLAAHGIHWHLIATTILLL